MKDKDPYSILEVTPDASYLEIKKAYRRLAKQYHPDRLSDPKESDQKRFADITQAYRMLSNLKQRRDYDARQDGEAAPSSYYRPHYSGYPYFQFDIFTPYFHSFFMGSNAAGKMKSRSPWAFFLNARVFLFAILGALYFFKFFSAATGIVQEKKIEDRMFNTQAHVLILKQEGETDENKTRKKKVKKDIYEIAQKTDRIEKKLFSFEYRINDNVVSSVELNAFVLQTLWIHLALSFGLLLLEKGRRV